MRIHRHMLVVSEMGERSKSREISMAIRGGASGDFIFRPGYFRSATRVRCCCCFLLVFSCLLSAANQPPRTYTYMDGCGGYQERDHHFLYVRKSIHLLWDQNGKTEDSRFEALQLKKACLLMD